MRLLVVDTETGGLNPEMYSLLEVGLVALEDKRIIGTDRFYVKEDVVVTCDAAMNVNKIDLSVIDQQGVSCEEAVDRIRRMTLHLQCGDDDAVTKLAGWNLDFDKKFLLRMYRMAEGNPELFSLPKYFSYRGVDVPSIMFAMADSGIIDMKPDDVNSDNAFEYFGVQPSEFERHTALGDARSTARLIVKILERFEYMTTRFVNKFIERLRNPTTE